MAAGVVTPFQSNDMRARKGWSAERPSQVLLGEGEMAAGCAELHPEVCFMHHPHYSVEKTKVEATGLGPTARSQTPDPVASLRTGGNSSPCLEVV